MWEIKRAIREGLGAVGRVFLWIFTLTSMVSPIAIAGITENWKWAWLLIVTIPFFGGFGGWFIDHS